MLMGDTNQDLLELVERQRLLRITLALVKCPYLPFYPLWRYETVRRHGIQRTSLFDQPVQ